MFFSKPSDELLKISEPLTAPGISVIEGLGLSMFAQKQDVFDAATWTPLFLALTLYKTAFFAYIMSLLYFVQILLVSLCYYC